MQSLKTIFESQIQLIKANINENTIILGDFYLDQNKRYHINYSNKLYFDALSTSFEPHNLVQVIDFNTWSRTINNVNKSSVIDHVYLKDPTSIKNISSLTPPFGDHKLVSFDTSIEKLLPKQTFKRNWKNYTKEKLIAELTVKNWQIKRDSVQSYWNEFESMLVEIVDRLAPLQTITQIEKDKSKPNPHIKNKINKRNRL